MASETEEGRLPAAYGATALSSRHTTRVATRVKFLDDEELSITAWAVSPTLRKVVFAITTTASFLFCFNISIFNGALSKIAQDLKWCPDGLTGNECLAASRYGPAVNAAVFLGAVLGASGGSSLLRFGCRKALSTLLLIHAIATLASAAAVGAYSLAICRFVVGITIGGITVVVPTFLSEIAPASERGFVGTIHQVFGTCGNVVAILVGLPLAFSISLSDFDKVWWRLILAIGAVPAIVGAVFFHFVFTHETPTFHIRRGAVENATTALRLLRDTEDVSKEIQSILRVTSNGSRVKSNILQAVSRRPFLVAFGAFFAVGQQLCGINGFMASSSFLFRAAGMSSLGAWGAGVALAVLQVVMTFPAMRFVETWGRRKLMLFGVSGMIGSVTPAALLLSLRPNAIFTTWTAVAGAFGFMFFYGISYGPLCWIYVFEIFPSHMKDSASSVATAVHWIGATAMVFLSGVLSVTEVYTLFGCLQILTLLVLYAFMKETKGRTVGSSPYD